MSYSVSRIVTGPFQENTFLLVKDDTKELILIDPGDDAENLIQEIDEHEYKPVAILNTHAHLDHIGAVYDLKKHYSIPFYLPEQEKYNLDNYKQSCMMFGLTPSETPSVDTWLNDTVTIPGFVFNVIKTPGHTKGSTCYLINGHLFTGDTLFHLSVGRTDLPGGNWDELQASLKVLMAKIGNEVVIHSGHGPDTTMEVEKAQNPFLLQIANS